MSQATQSKPLALILPEVNIVKTTKCPICGNELRIEIQQNITENIELIHYPVPHMVIHGDPIHAFVVYIDAHNKIRGYEKMKYVHFPSNTNANG